MSRPFVACLALMLAGCAADRIAARSTLPPGSKYVAMGSSFSAGAAIGPEQPGSPKRCSRTVNNYPSLLAERLGLKLDDRTCGGATAVHLLGPWNELPAQIATVDQDTRLVTVTIGGNDLNYAGYLFMASCQPGRIYEAGGYKIPCTTPQPPNEQSFARLEIALREIAREVRHRAPSAKLVFVQYVSLVPNGPCPAANLPATYAPTARMIGRRLATITARVARESGALLLSADRMSRGHTACDRNPWSNGMTETIDLSHGAPWHPNAAGHQAIAEALQGLLQPS